MRTLVCFAVVACLALCLVGAAAGRPLYSVYIPDGGSLAAIANAGVRVRHVGMSEVLVEADSGVAAAIRSRGHTVEFVCDTDLWEALFVCLPAVTTNDLLRYGDVLWHESSGAVLVGTTEDQRAALRGVCFAGHALPDSVEVTPRLPRRLPPGAGGVRDERALRGVVQDVIESISPDSLMAHVDRLSRYSDDGLRTRYVGREECLTEAEPYLVDRLSASLPEGALVDTQRFIAFRTYTCDEGPSGPKVPYPADNVVGVLSGSERLQGCYVVCAHYDATAKRSFPDTAYFWWCDNPAPGADDNATGVAVVLEAARVLSDAVSQGHIVFPFDIRFVLFSAEEIWFVGSEAYVEEAAAAGDTIYGVINVDMIAYEPDESAPDTCHVVTNYASMWLADWIVQTAESAYEDQFPEFDTKTVHYTVPLGDHQSFWDRGYDAVLAIEHWNPRDRNPYYHTLEDTIASISSTQFTNVARMVAASLARLADPGSDTNVAVFDRDIAFDPDDLIVGSETVVGVEAHVFGREDTVALTIEIWDGDPDGGVLLESFPTVERMMGGGETIWREFAWDLEADDLGDHVIHVRAVTDGIEEPSYADNVASIEVNVSSSGSLFVNEHYVERNPARSLEEIRFRYELSRQAHSAQIEVLDVTGQVIGTIDLVGGGDNGTRSGWNSIAWESFDEGGGDLASGVYIYRIVVYQPGASPPEQVFGKFALVR